LPRRGPRRGAVVFRTTVTIPLGETVVLGSGHISMAESGEEAAIPAVTPRIVDERQP